MNTQQTPGSIDARRAITGWLVRTVLFIPFIGAIIFWAAGTIKWLNAWVYVTWYLVVSVAAVFLSDPALLAERSSARRVKGQKGWNKLLLGSAWALIPGVLGRLLLVIRTILEDRTLQRELDGYLEYAARVRSRLLPEVW